MTRYQTDHRHDSALRNLLSRKHRLLLALVVVCLFACEKSKDETVHEATLAHEQQSEKGGEHNDTGVVRVTLSAAAARTAGIQTEIAVAMVGGSSDDELDVPG